MLCQSPTKIKRLKTTHSDFQFTGSFDNKQEMTEKTNECGQTTFSGLVYPNMMDMTMDDSIIRDVGIESTISATNNLLPVYTPCLRSTNSEPDLDAQRLSDPECFHQQQMLSTIGQNKFVSSNTELKSVNEISDLQTNVTKGFSKPQQPYYDPHAMVKCPVDLDDPNFFSKLKSCNPRKRSTPLQ